MPTFLLQTLTRNFKNDESALCCQIHNNYVSGMQRGFIIAIVDKLNTTEIKVLENDRENEK